MNTPPPSLDSAPRFLAPGERAGVGASGYETYETSLGPAGFRVRSEFPEIVAWLARDYVAAPQTAGAVRLEVRVLRARASQMPGPLRSGRSAWRVGGETAHVWFFGAVAVHYDPLNHYAMVAGENPSLIYEALEFVLASYLGEWADARGWHRVHGLGVAYGGRGVLFLGKAGAGKTTLGAELFSQPGAGYFSDDVPWVASDGTLRAYPHRFSFKVVPQFPVDKTRPHHRPRYGDRFYVDAAVFAERWSAPYPLTKIFLLRRAQSRSCLKVSRPRLFAWLFRWLVVGLETPQIFELRVRLGRHSLTAGVKAFISRLRLAARLAREAQGYVLTYRSGDHPARVLEN